MTPPAQLWTTCRLQCLDGTGTYVRLTAAAFGGRQCECAAAAARPAAAGRLSGMKIEPKMRNCLRIDYAEIPYNYAVIMQRLCRHYAVISQSLREDYADIMHSLRRDYGIITQFHYVALRNSLRN